MKDTQTPFRKRKSIVIDPLYEKRGEYQSNCLRVEEEHYQLYFIFENKDTPTKGQNIIVLIKEYIRENHKECFVSGHFDLAQMMNGLNKELVSRYKVSLGVEYCAIACSGLSSGIIQYSSSFGNIGIYVISPQRMEKIGENTKRSYYLGTKESDGLVPPIHVYPVNLFDQILICSEHIYSYIEKAGGAYFLVFHRKDITTIQRKFSNLLKIKGQINDISILIR